MNCLRFTNLGFRKTISAKRNVSDFSHRIFVSVTGNDTNTGSEESPFLTIEKAISYSETLSGNVLITIEKGDYHISESISINTANKITITGKKGVVLKGSEIATFVTTEDSTIVKSSKSYNSVFQIFSNNDKILSASMERVKLVTKYNGMYIAAIYSITDSDNKTSQAIDITSTDVALLSVNDAYKVAQITIMHNWASSKVRIRSIDTVNNRIIFRPFQNPAGDGNLWAASGDALFVENIKNGLSLNSYQDTFTQGTFYQDNDGYIYYKFRDGETLSNTILEIPITENIFDIGSNVNIYNLSFSQTNYNFFDATYACSDTQSAYSIPGVVKVRGSNVFINRCEFYDVSQNSIEFLNGSSSCRVDNCYFHNIGCGAVKVGELNSSASNVPYKIIVNNCVIEYIGELLQQSAGLIMTFADSCYFTHNDVSKTYYTGITSGHIWGKNTSDTYFKNCYIGYNHIHHICCKTMSDLGAIYNLGSTQGLVVEYNKIHDVIAQLNSGAGLYLDEGTKGSIWRNNLVYKVAHGTMFHWTNNNTVSNNIFSKMTVYGCLLLANINDIFTHNILYNAKTIFSLDSPINQTVLQNIYWNDSADILSVSQDSSPIISNPNFRDVSIDDYFLSTAPTGFSIFDYAKIGVIGNRMNTLLLNNIDFYDKYIEFMK